jgi:Ca2+-binding EF-hand superfamily protein
VGCLSDFLVHLCFCPLSAENFLCHKVTPAPAHAAVRVAEQMGLACSQPVKIPAESPVASITERQLEEFREAFKTFDKDGGGSIDAAELKDLINNVGSTPTDEEIREMIAMADADGSGSIDFAEFVTLMAHNMAGTEKKEAGIEAAFQVFDVDGGGSISPVELKSILVNVGEPVTQEDLEAVVAKIDVDGDGEIDLEEFASFVLTGARTDGRGAAVHEEECQHEKLEVPDTPGAALAI